MKSSKQTARYKFPFPGTTGSSDGRCPSIRLLVRPSNSVSRLGTPATLQHWLQNLGVGGVILLGGSAPELALRSQQLQDWAKIPLLIAADIEEGVGQRFLGATWFPPPMALGAIARKDPTLAQQYAQQMGAVTAQEALAIGINWVLAPVVDVNNNPDNPVIHIRAFGETSRNGLKNY